MTSFLMNGAVCGSLESGLKSATAMRMLAAPLEVEVLNQSCACNAGTQSRRREKAASQNGSRAGE